MVMISVLVLLGLGLVTATVLAVASRVFHVEEDPRVQAVLEALPGANCGGCGYAGCEGYATAVATDPAVPANCCAGGAETSIAVGELTGKTVAASDPLVSFRRCDKVAGNVALRYDYQGMPSCAAAAGLVGGSDSCSYSCLGFGDCVHRSAWWPCAGERLQVYGLRKVRGNLPPQRAGTRSGSRPGDGLLFHQGQAQGRDGSLQGRLHQVRALRQELSRRCGHAGERPHPHQS